MTTAFDRDDPRGLVHALVDSLKQRILAGEFSPGEPIPSETALSSEFRLSRTVVREATASLRAAGLVDTFHGRGSIVVELPEREAPSPGWLEVRGPADLLDAMDLRLGVEPQAAALAAERRTPAQLAAVLRASEDLAGLDADRSGLVRADFAFHEQVAAASGNRYIVALITGLGPRSILRHRAGLAEASTADDARFARLVHEHAAIAEAIERSDPDGASAAMRAHLRRSRAQLAG